MQEDGEGVAVCTVKHKATGKPLYCLITYVYPTLSARAVPQLKEFCETHRRLLRVVVGRSALLAWLVRRLTVSLVRLRVRRLVVANLA